MSRVVGRRGQPTPAPGPGPTVAEGSGVSCIPAPGSGLLAARCPPTPGLPEAPGPSHHAENTVRLAVQRLRQGWDLHTLRDSHRPPIEVSDNHIQLWTKGSAWSGPHRLSTGPGAARRKRHHPHQVLRLCLEGGVDPNDEGRGRAEDLQELCRQDGHVGEAATGRGSVAEPQGSGWAGGGGQAVGGKVGEALGTCI